MTDDPKRLVYEVKMMLSSVASHGPAALTTTDDPMYTANLLARLRDALVARTTPPTDDEREALAGIAREAWAHYQAIQDDPEFGGDFEDVLAYRLGLAGFRRQGPITDAQYIAARDAYEVASSGHVVTEVAMRAALEAAERAR